MNYTLDHTENDAYPVMSSDADLVYTAVRIQHEGYLHHIWTQRIPTNEEKTRLVELVNIDLSSRGQPGDATVANVHWVSGLPINHEFVWKPQPNGYKVSFTRQNTNTIHVNVDNHGAFSNICYGTLRYNYTAGSTDFKNEIQPVNYVVEKYWADGQSTPEGTEVVVRLSGTIPGEVTDTNPNPAPVQVNLAAIGVTQKTEVKLNGGAEGGDDTTQDPWKYTWSNLPQYDKAGHQITYRASEISYTIDGKTVDLTTFAPTEDTSTPNTLLLTNQIPNYSFDILKIDADSAKPLDGAQFTIQAVEPASNTSEPTIAGQPSASDPETTGADGKASFNNIPLGYYEVAEAKSPDGYVITDDGKFYIKVDAQGVRLLEKVITEGKLSFKEVEPNAEGKITVGDVTYSIWENKVTITVENTPGAALPKAGSPGTALFTILGIMLMAFAGAGMLVMKNRRKAA